MYGGPESSKCIKKIHAKEKNKHTRKLLSSRVWDTSAVAMVCGLWIYWSDKIRNLPKNTHNNSVKRVHIFLAGKNIISYFQISDTTCIG